jgi:hypothetical protein
MALYSASVLERDIVCYFLAFYDTKLQQKKIANPHVDLRSSEQPAQSASLNALRIDEEDSRILSPRPDVCLIYRRIRLTAAQWAVVGALRY